jgi:hypothetical protein
MAWMLAWNTDKNCVNKWLRLTRDHSRNINSYGGTTFEQLGFHEGTFTPPYGGLQ